MRGRTLFISAVLLLIILPLAVYVPVRQAAENRELAFEVAELEGEIQQLDEEIRKLRVEIAELESPDRVARLIEFYADVEKADEKRILIVTDESQDREEEDER
jgi:cell division protein FtsL